jgi:hypothetical protein
MTHHADDFAGSLGLSCVLGASLEVTLGEDSPLANTSDRGAAIANVPQVPQVHQSCVRTDLSTERQGDNTVTFEVKVAPETG